MNTTKVKICGIRTKGAAIEIVKAGADFLGFNFVKNSSRYISKEETMEIISLLPKEVKIVGVFQNESIENIRETIAMLKLDFVQLHGDESKNYSSLTQYAGVIKTIPYESTSSYQEIARKTKGFDVDYFLLDRKIQGEGELMNLDIASEIAKRYKIFLAGGLTAATISSVIDRVHPFAVDVASGIETDGMQDIEKIQEFIKKVKQL